MAINFKQWAWASEESEYRCPGGIFECNPSKAACGMDVKTTRRFCCDYEGICWTEGVKCGADTTTIRREDEDPFCCVTGREKADPNRGGACWSTLDNPLLDIPVKELQAAYSRSLSAADPTAYPSFDPFDLDPTPPAETTSSSSKTTSSTTSTTSSTSTTTTTTNPTPAETSNSPSQTEVETETGTETEISEIAETGTESTTKTRPFDDNEDTHVTSSRTFDPSAPLATETSSSSTGGYLGGISDNNTQNTNNNGLSTGAMAGIIVAAVVVGVALAVGLLFLLRRKEQQKRSLNGGGPHGEMIGGPDDDNNKNPNQPLEVLGVTLLFKKPKSQSVTFGGDDDSTTDVGHGTTAPTSPTSRTPPMEMTDSSRTELRGVVPVEVTGEPVPSATQGTNVVELSATKSQRWRYT